MMSLKIFVCHISLFFSLYHCYNNHKNSFILQKGEDGDWRQIRVDGDTRGQGETGKGGGGGGGQSRGGGEGENSVPVE